MGHLSLCVDSSIRGVALALLQGQGDKSQVVWQKVDHSRYGSAGILSQYFRQALDEVGATVADIARIIVSTGPGSFTGIKVGLAWCYGLAAPFRRELAWMGVSALEEAAAEMARARSPLLGEAAASGGSLSLFIPSTATHGYLAQYERSSGQTRSCLLALEPAGSPALARLMSDLGASQVVMGTAWPMLADLLEERGIAAVSLSSKELMDYVLAGLVAKARTASSADFSSELPRPRYLRKSTAEEKLELQRGSV